MNMVRIEHVRSILALFWSHLEQISASDFSNISIFIICYNPFSQSFFKFTFIHKCQAWGLLVSAFTARTLSGAASPYLFIPERIVPVQSRISLSIINDDNPRRSRHDHLSTLLIVSSTAQYNQRITLGTFPNTVYGWSLIFEPDSTVYHGFPNLSAACEFDDCLCRCVNTLLLTWYYRGWQLRQLNCGPRCTMRWVHRGGSLGKGCKVRHQQDQEVSSSDRFRRVHQFLVLWLL